VLGMELEVRDGKVGPRYKEGRVQTYRRGKVEAIRLKPGARGDPLFGAGDSDGDFEMLSTFKGMDLALILNRLKGGKVGDLCRRAVKQKGAPAPRYILQG